MSEQCAVPHSTGAGAGRDSWSLVEAAVDVLLAGAPIGFAVLDADLRYVRVNDRLAEINGVPARAHAGRTIGEVVPDLADAAVAAFRRVLETGQPLLELELSGQVASSPGVLRHWVESVYPLGREGQADGLVVIVWEVTARVEAQQGREHTLALLDTLIGNAPMGIAFLDTDLRYVRINEHLAAVNGLPVAEHLGRTIREVLPGLADDVEPLLRHVIDTRVPILGLELETGDVPAQPGRRRYWQVNYYPVISTDGLSVEGVGLLISDVTVAHEIEQERERLHEAERAALAAAQAAQQQERRSRASAERTANRLTSLYALTTRLAATVHAEQVAEILVQVCMPALGASGATVLALEGEQAVRPLAMVGLQAETSDVQSEMIAWLPLLRDITASDRPVLVTSFADRDRRYPTLAGVSVRQQAWANLPLRVEDRLVGIATFGWDEPRTFTDEDVDYLISLATHAAIALDRAGLVETSLARAEKLQALQQVTAGLATAATREQIAGVMVTQAVGLIAEYVVMAFVDEESGCWRTVASPNMPAEVAQPFAAVPFATAQRTPITYVASTGESLALDDLREVASRYPEVMNSLRATRTESLFVVPVKVAEQSVGAMAFGFSTPGPIDSAMISLANTLAELAGQALQRADLYEAEHQVAHELQRALLPVVPPELPHLQVGACYRPSDDRREIGGDWYDVFELSDGRVAFAVGDVVGHDLHAATVMGQLQTLLRSAAMMDPNPIQVLGALDRACAGIEGADCTTVGYGEYLPVEAQLRYACAGHPPPLLVQAHTVQYLQGGRSTPIGVATTGERSQEQVSIPAGSLLVWYSDGLIERRGEDLDVGFERLSAVAQELPRPGHSDWPGPQSWTEALLREMTAGRRVEDDIAVICLHLRAGPGGR